MADADRQQPVSKVAVAVQETVQAVGVFELALPAPLRVSSCRLPAPT
jgi:hypothetical protein